MLTCCLEWAPAGLHLRNRRNECPWAWPCSSLEHGMNVIHCSINSHSTRISFLHPELFWLFPHWPHQLKCPHLEPPSRKKPFQLSPSTSLPQTIQNWGDLWHCAIWPCMLHPPNHNQVRGHWYISRGRSWAVRPWFLSPNRRIHSACNDQGSSHAHGCEHVHPAFDSCTQHATTTIHLWGCLHVFVTVNDNRCQSWLRWWHSFPNYWWQYIHN